MKTHILGYNVTILIIYHYQNFMNRIKNSSKLHTTRRKCFEVNYCSVSHFTLTLSVAVFNLSLKRDHQKKSMTVTPMSR